MVLPPPKLKSKVAVRIQRDADCTLSGANLILVVPDAS